MRARPRAVALHGALLAVLVAGPLAYVTAGKSVTLQVDGSARDVRTYASTVGSVLQQQGIKVGSHDVVAPDLSAPLSSGMRVAILRGRPVHLVVDGAARDVWTTARDVQSFASSLGGRYEQAYLSVSRSTRIPLSGLTFDVHMPKTVTVVYGGHPAVIVTTAATWAEAITHAGLRLGTTAQLSVPADSVPMDGEQVSVILTGVRTVTHSIAIPYLTVQSATSALYVGSSRVVTAGIPGKWSEVWRYTLHNGVVVARTRVSRRLVARPVTQVVEYGTRRHVARSSGYPQTSVDGLDWAALARCESGGDPTAVGGGGTYFGLYQFSLSAWASVGGSGNPVDASSAEQTYRAKLLYERRGAGAWPYCGQFL